MSESLPLAISYELLVTWVVCGSRTDAETCVSVSVPNLQATEGFLEGPHRYW